MDRDTCLDSLINIEQFSARGEISIEKNKLSFDFQNGIASFRFIERKDRDSIIIQALSDKWICFDDYWDNEFGGEKDNEPSRIFYALLKYGYYNGYALCFYVQSVICQFSKGDIYSVNVFSPCLINHFVDIEKFDFNSNGYIEEFPCASYTVQDGIMEVYRTIAVEYNRHKISYRFSFQKSFWGGFRFQFDKPFTWELLKRCVDSVNDYCCFLLHDSGVFISNVELDSNEDNIRNHLYYPPKMKKIETEILFSFDDIRAKFSSILGAFFENGTKFTPLYLSKSNVYQPIDILRIASMFENQYRKNAEVLIDYREFEQKYKSAYLKVITINEAPGQLEESILVGEKAKRDRLVMSTLKMQLQFVFDKLLNTLGTDRTKVKNSLAVKLYDYKINNLAQIIKDARNDIAHYLENSVDYNVALKHTFILQLMVYYMIFERVGLEKDVIKKIILGTSRYSKWIFDIK